MKTKNTLDHDRMLFRLRPKREQGSVLMVSFGIMAILLLLVAITLRSTSNKYLTAYQWASWQEALQGAESGADIAMGEMRKDVTGSGGPAFAGWSASINQISKQLDSNGYYPANQGGGGGNSTQFTLGALRTHSFEYVTYSTQLTPHQGEGNTNLTVRVTIDAPASLVDSSGRQWLRVRASGTTDLVGGAKVSEEKLDNRLRKLGLYFDKVLGVTPNGPQATRKIELVAKPVTMFAGALTSMVQLKIDDQGIVTDSFNSEDRVNWPINPNTLEYDLTVSHDPTSPLGKNGDVGSNAFPIKHDHSMELNLNGNAQWNTTIWGDVGNNYTAIKKVDSTYYNPTVPYDPLNPTYGLDSGAYGTTNPNTTLIKTDGTADISGTISSNFYRDLPAVPEPNWTSSVSDYRYFSKVDHGTADIDNTSTDPNNPTHIQIGTTGAKGNLTLAAADKWVLKAAPKPSGWNYLTSPPVHRYVAIWVTGDIKLDDGGTVVLEQKTEAHLVNGVNVDFVISDVTATIYVDHNIKVGETKETKTNAGGFDNQSDDAKNLIILGVTQPDSGKLTSDAYYDPLGNGATYTPYKASGNIVFTENDFTGAIYAPDHNIVFNNSADGRGKRHKRKQAGADFYGSYVGRTINNKKGINVHFDESLNDAGPIKDWGYVSWFEDVDVDHR
jgi:hypothetical protein